MDTADDGADDEAGDGPAAGTAAAADVGSNNSQRAMLIDHLKSEINGMIDEKVQEMIGQKSTLSSGLGRRQASVRVIEDEQKFFVTVSGVTAKKP